MRFTKANGRSIRNPVPNQRFPEFTGRICPALCEKSCVLKLAIDAPVTIREDEAAIIEAAFREGYVKPKTYPRNGKKVAVVVPARQAWLPPTN